MSLLLAFALLQAGPLVSPGAAPPIAHPPLRDEKTRRRRGGETVIAAPEPGRLEQCLKLANEDAEAGEERAEAWLKQETGSARAEPMLCLGTAQAAQEDWAAAETSFLTGRDLAATSDRLFRARLGAMAGNAALAAGAPERALAALDLASVDAGTAAEPHLNGDIALDRARALVLLKRNDEAAKALVTARTESPNNPQAWLLSATLSRRTGRLTEAQAQIQTAADLAPVDPEVGLEAGVIAVLQGRDEAARKSWQSVLAAAPDSPQATTAKGYIAQLPVAQSGSGAAGATVK